MAVRATSRATRPVERGSAASRVNGRGGLSDAEIASLLRAMDAAAGGDFSVRVRPAGSPAAQELAAAFNALVESNAQMAREISRVRRVVGRDGLITERAAAPLDAGGWKTSVDALNALIDDLVRPTTEFARVIDAVAKGDLSQKMALRIEGRPVKGEFLRIRGTVNLMVDRLSSFAGEVTRVAREVGTEGKLGGQAKVKGVSGTWRDLTDSVNSMASNLTDQVRNIAHVATAVARGDLSRQITVDVKGEVLQLKDTINTMVDQLSSFADEVTRVASEVGTEGKLGGQANVEDVSGTWRHLTDSVNSMASNLTDQVRAIAAVSMAVTQGDLTRSIGVEAQGEVAELKDTINQMIVNLRETTGRNADQAWLNSNLARFGGMMQGQRDLGVVSTLIMSELTPLVGARFGAFFLVKEHDEGEPTLELAASYGYRSDDGQPLRYRPGEGLVGQVAVDKRPVLIEAPPADYIAISSGLGRAAPSSIILQPVLFEDRALGVIELASFEPFSEVHQTFLEQLAETIGIVINAIVANVRTEVLLEQSQSLTQELQSRQHELQQTNAELAEKATLLAEQNERIEVKNREIEMARLAVEEKAEQLTLSSRYKSEFLANMSHELRTPLNSLLILARLLADNQEGNLSGRQVDFAQTIFAAGNELLDMIDDILDLSKVEAGKMDMHPGDVALSGVVEFVERSFRLLVEEKGLGFEVALDDDLAAAIVTDEQRLQQILRNLLSNAVKFTESGGVTFRIAAAPPGAGYASPALAEADDVIAFSVTDSGIGIAEDRLGLIFEAFQQADGTTSRRFGGTGLGLSISREIARLLGGELAVESSVGRGSTFTLFLPRVLRQEVPAPAAASEASASRRADGADEPGPDLAPALEDDRESVTDADRVLLVVEDDATFAQTLVGLARDAGFKAIAALRGDTGLALAHEFRPDAIVLDMGLPVIDGWTVLSHLKRHPATADIPVHVVSGAGGSQDALKDGAASAMVKPIPFEDLSQALAEMAGSVDAEPVRVLLVGSPGEDGDGMLSPLAELAGVEAAWAATVEQAAAALQEAPPDAILVEVDVGDGGALGLLERLSADAGAAPVPVGVASAREVTHDEAARLAEGGAFVVNGSSPTALLAGSDALIAAARTARRSGRKRSLSTVIDERVFDGKHVLIVDDDVRNVFALASALEARGMEVAYAETGAEGIEVLQARDDIDIVLLDVMMPGIDGYETTAAIRAMAGLAALPIIAVTAKAMPGDRERAIAAGASDYVTKPVDLDQLLSLMGIWLYPAATAPGEGDRAPVEA